MAERAFLGYPRGALLDARNLLLVGALGLTGVLSGACDPEAGASPGDAGDAPKATATATAAPKASGSAKAAAPADKASRIQMLAFAFTSEVKNREPSDKLDAAGPGQRVYAHLTVRNRTGATVPLTLTFSVNGEERSKVDLKADASWSFRTWGYNTLRKGDLTGELVVEIRDDQGVVATHKLPIKGDGAKAPPGKPVPLSPED